MRLAVNIAFLFRELPFLGRVEAARDAGFEAIEFPWPADPPDEVAAAVKQPDVASRFAIDGTEGIGSSPAEFAAHLKSEREQWAKVVKIANIRKE